VHDIFAIDMDIDTAIRYIQRSERGRQGIARINTIRKIIKNQEQEKRDRIALKKGKKLESSQQVKEAKAAEVLQKRFRGITARKAIEQMREEEMIFLGMKQRPKTALERETDPLVERQRVRDR
jgi:hypothetical protein